jgi:hypothetical protein
VTEDQQRRVQASRDALAWMQEDRRWQRAAVYWFLFVMLGIATGAVVILLAGLR